MLSLWRASSASRPPSCTTGATCWVPPGVEEKHVLGGREVQTQAARLPADQEKPAVLAEKPDLTGGSRVRERNQGKALVGKSTLNRLELT